MEGQREMGKFRRSLGCKQSRPLPGSLPNGQPGFSWSGVRGASLRTEGPGWSRVWVLVCEGLGWDTSYGASCLGSGSRVLGSEGPRWAGPQWPLSAAPGGPAGMREWGCRGL